MILVEELRSVLGNHRLIASLEPHRIFMLAALAHRVQFRPGEVIFHEGDTANWFYVVESGSVELGLATPSGVTVVETLRASDEMGWSSLFGTGSKHFTAKATTFVTALAFDGARLREAFEHDPAFGYRFMQSMLTVATERLDAARQKLAESRARAVSAT